MEKNWIHRIILKQYQYGIELSISLAIVFYVIYVKRKRSVFC